MQIPAGIVEKAKAAYSEALQDPHRDVVEFDSMVLAMLEEVADDLTCWRLGVALGAEDSMAWLMSGYQGALPGG